MTPLELRQRLREGGTAIGTLIVSASPRYPDSVSRIGFDFVFIDTEHIAIDRALLSWMCQLYRALGLPPIVRIPSPDPYQACCVLDGGAAGIVGPYIENAAQARALVGAVKFRPLKGRRLEAFLGGRSPLEPELRAYLDRNNAGHLLILNIESVPAIEALDEILAVPGVDGVLIGPHDLSCSLGIPEGYDDPRFEQAVKDILARVRAKGAFAGIHSWLGVEREADLIRAGANFLIHEADLLTFRSQAARDLARLREATDAPRPADSPQEKET